MRVRTFPAILALALAAAGCGMSGSDVATGPAATTTGTADVTEPALL